MPLFDRKSNNVIRRGMKKWENRHNRFVKISKLIPKYSPKQIASHWRNYLDPNLSMDPLNNKEKRFIIEWTQKHRTSSGVVRWKYLVYDLKCQFGKQHSENKAKNFWNSRKKTHSRIEQRFGTDKKEKETEANEQRQEEQGDARTQEQSQEQGEREEYNFVLHFLPSNNSFIFPKDQNTSHTKITISSLLNYDNNNNCYM